MRVAIVHDFLTQLAGAERVVIALHDLFPQADVYTLVYDERSSRGAFKDWNITPSFLQHGLISRNRKYAVGLYPLAIESFDLSGYDLVISSGAFAKGALTRPETTHINYCHTPTLFLWSWTHQYLREQNLGWLTGSYVRHVLHKTRQWDRLAAERPDYWIANSHNVQERITKYYRKTSTVIYPPVATARFRMADKIGDYFIYVGRLSAYKRPALVVETFNKLGLPLKVVGEGEQLDLLRSRAGKNVEILGWQDDKTTADLISRSRALIFPVEEDFGIVPVEAMAAGRPVIALDRGGALETVVDGKTGVFFPEPTFASLTAAIKRFQSLERGFDSSIIRAQARRFDTAVFKKKILSFVSEHNHE